MKLVVFVATLLLSVSVFAKDKKCNDFAKYGDIKPAEMTKLIKNKTATIIDVNSKDSFKKSHIPGAIHYASHSENLASKLPKNKDALIVAYCGGKSCTAWQRAAKTACKMGYKNIKHFSEGITGWNKMQLEKMKTKNS